MKIHEYQAKGIFAAHGIPIPEGSVAHTVEEAETIAGELGPPVVVKAQVHVGGRGKAGGIKIAKSVSEAAEHARAILNMTIKDLPVRAVLIERTADIATELYASLIIDRARRCPVFLTSARGGVDIEEVARETPEDVITTPVDALMGLRDFHARRALLPILPDRKLVRQGAAILSALYDVFFEEDCSLVEINPLVVTGDGRLVALDAKINIDDNALFRHPVTEALRDMSAEDNRELEANQAGLSYVALEGAIGCVVNGAGLAMATMDLVQKFGQERGVAPANFLDIGGSSSPEKVLTALRILLTDASVKVILFNIFGGITRCDDVAQGIVQAKAELDIRQPIVARLVGTNEDEARGILESVNLISATTMEEAVQKAVATAAGA